MAKPSLHVVLPAACEVTGAGGGRFDGIGLAIDSGSLCIAAGSSGKISLHPIAAIKKVHLKFIDNGRLTFEVAAARGAMRQILVSKAQKADLSSILQVLDVSTKQARARNLNALPQEEYVALLQKRYPEQVRKQLAALRAANGGDNLQMLKGHTRLMLVLDSGGLSPAQAGKELCALAQDFGLATHVRPAECNAQAYMAVAKDATKETQLSMRVRSCIHHRWASALFLDIDVAAGVEPAKLRAACVKRLCADDESRVSTTTLAHGAIKERLAMGLVVHLRSGT